MTQVVAALIWSGDKFMICQRPAHKARGLLWEFVGGKVEPGETKEAALIRECREELAVTVSVGGVFLEVTHTYPDLTIHLTLFHASIAEGSPQKLEHNDIRWITVDEIPQYEFCPADQVILAKLRSREDSADTAFFGVPCAFSADYPPRIKKGRIREEAAQAARHLTGCGPTYLELLNGSPAGGECFTGAAQFCSNCA